MKRFLWFVVVLKSAVVLWVGVSGRLQVRLSVYVVLRHHRRLLEVVSWQAWVIALGFHREAFSLLLEHLLSVSILLPGQLDLLLVLSSRLFFNPLLLLLCSLLLVSFLLDLLLSPFLVIIHLLLMTLSGMVLLDEFIYALLVCS